MLSILAFSNYIPHDSVGGIFFSPQALLFVDNLIMEISKRLLPVGIQDFEKLRTENYIYVDKTELIYNLVQDNHPYFISRPRRFGKSLLISTLEAYFSGKKQLFNNLKISEFEKDWIIYPVIKLGFASNNYSSSKNLLEKLNTFLCEYETQYQIQKQSDNPSERLYLIITQIYKKTGKPIVILIDEYDKPILDALFTSDEKLNRDILQGFYGPLKELDHYIRFIFITGITKIAHINIFSGLNQLDDISMNEKYAYICGLTEDEIKNNFKPEIKSLGNRRNKSFDETLLKLEEMYDGYHFCPDTKGLYNPFSLLKAFSEKKYSSYWFETGTPSMLLKTLEKNPSNLFSLINGIKTKESNFIKYDPESKNLLPVLYQSGYLTIKSYNDDSNLYTLNIPNKEVEEGLFNIILPRFTSITENDLGITIENLKKAFLDHNIDFIMNIVKTTIYDIPTIMKKKSCENYYESIMHVLFRLTGFTIISELQSVNGRSDIVVITIDSVYIFELKMDIPDEKTAIDHALKQIEEKEYAERFKLSKKIIYKIIVVFSSAGKGLINWKKIN